MDFFSVDLYRNVAVVIGVIYISQVVIHRLCDIFSFFRAYILALIGIRGVNLLKYGSWAVVTGASEGIGRAYSLELAKRGLNVVLMSRSEEKLNKVANEIRDKYGRQAKVVPVDFSDGLDIYSRLAKELLELDVGVLVNNVGLGVAYPDIMSSMSKERLYKIVSINCHPTVQMTRMLLPAMASRGGGIVVNFSSGSSIYTTPLFTVYSATKVFVDYISEGLHKEYADKGIIIQNVQPFLVATAMSGVEETSLFRVSAMSYARAAVATIGIQKNTHGYPSHALQGYIFSHCIPEWLYNMMVYYGSSEMKALMSKRNKD